jgi:hypothetical protein
VKIYKDEVISGLKDRILSENSVAFVTKLETQLDPILTDVIQKAFASKAKYIDGLYHTKSILVSTVWNLNDDVFDKSEVWLARSTPEDKPTNLGHDEKQIVGHITGNWPVTTDGKLIDSETTIDDLPDIYHIINSAVIYTLWQDKDLTERTKALIDEIEDDKKYVSMECTFKGFDYAVKDPQGGFHVLTRSSETAFLTKHLRAYGGDGTYQDHKIGRLLRNITFSGKGYVDKPANPSSIILKGEEFSFSTAKENDIVFSDDGVIFINAKTNLEIQMTVETDKTIEVNKKLVESEVALTKANSDLKVANDKIDELTKANDKLVSDLKSTNDKLTAETAKSAELTKTVEETVKAKSALDIELTTIKSEALKNKRISQLVEGGVAKDVAEAKVVAFSTFNDEQFNIVSEALVTAAKSCAKPTESDIDEDKNGEAAAKAAEAATAKAAEAAAKTDPVINPPAEEDKKLEVVRASMVNYFASGLGVKIDENK